MSRIHVISFAALGLFLVSCARVDDAPVKIETVRMSAEKFEQLYQSSYAKYAEDADGRKAFLEETINRKLMLLEAEKMGLDRDPQFLKEIEGFWQERLLKSVLNKKSREYQKEVRVTDEEVKAYFDQHPESFVGVTLEASSENIRQLLSRAKQQMMMEEWLKSLRDKAVVEIDYPKLGIQP